MRDFLFAEAAEVNALLLPAFLPPHLPSPIWGEDAPKGQVRAEEWVRERIQVRVVYSPFEKATGPRAIVPWFCRGLSEDFLAGRSEEWRGI